MWNIIIGILSIIGGLLPPHVSYWNGFIDSVCIVAGILCILQELEKVVKDKE